MKAPLSHAPSALAQGNLTNGIQVFSPSAGRARNRPPWRCPGRRGRYLTAATACKTISGTAGAVAKATPGSTVHVEPGTYV
jgi:hypothetical protein